MIRNVHERVINASIEALGALLDGLGQKDDRLWPSRSWPPMVLDRPLALGADGGHGVIRHILIGRNRGAMRLLFPAVVEPLHDAVVEDLLDNAEREATGTVIRPAMWSPRVRVLRRLTGDR